MDSVAVDDEAEAGEPAGVFHLERSSVAAVDLEGIAVGKLLDLQLQPLPAHATHLLAPGQVEQPLEV